jgi:hypothetical protein
MRCGRTTGVLRTHINQPAAAPAAPRRGCWGVSREPPAAAGMQASLKLSSEGAHEEAVVSTRTRADADGRLRDLAVAFE